MGRQTFGSDLSIMMLPRESRTFIVDKILEDLGNARDLMKEQSNSASMRLHKDVARALISEVALFEATWERYHYEKEKNKPEKFYDYTLSESDLNAKIESYLATAIEACKQVEARGYGRYTTRETLQTRTTESCLRRRILLPIRKSSGSRCLMVIRWVTA